VELLVAAGSAEELPGLLDWLEWGTLALDLRAIGAGGELEAPLPPERGAGAGLVDGSPAAEAGREEGTRRPLVLGRPGAPQGAAVWLRPPEPGCEVEASLPTVSALGGGGCAPDLVRVVDTVATQCHRLRLLRRRARP
jgi:hypothetical protein